MDLSVVPTRFGPCGLSIRVRVIILRCLMAALDGDLTTLHLSAHLLLLPLLHVLRLGIGIFTNILILLPDDFALASIEFT